MNSWGLGIGFVKEDINQECRESTEVSAEYIQKMYLTLIGEVTKRFLISKISDLECKKKRTALREMNTFNQSCSLYDDMDLCIDPLR